MNRFSTSPGDIAACWRNTARLQAKAGDADAAKNSREVAARVSGINAWAREHGRRPR